MMFVESVFSKINESIAVHIDTSQFKKIRSNICWFAVKEI